MIFASRIGHSRLVLAKIAFRFRKSLQGHLDATVADGMEPHLEPGSGPVIYQRVELRLRVLREPGILRIVAVGFQQRCCMRAQRTVHEAFQHARVQHGVGFRVMGAVLFQHVQSCRKWRPLGNPQGQLPFAL